MDKKEKELSSDLSKLDYYVPVNLLWSDKRETK